MLIIILKEKLEKISRSTGCPRKQNQEISVLIPKCEYVIVQAKEKTPEIQWEYKTVRINYMSEKYANDSIRILSKDLSILNEHGKDGWELCGVNNVNYYFKRKTRKD